MIYINFIMTNIELNIDTNLIPHEGSENIIQDENIKKIFLLSSHIYSHYDKLENNQQIDSILDIEKNSMCKMMKNCHSHLDNKDIKCIVLAMYITLYTELVNMNNM